MNFEVDIHFSILVCLPQHFGVDFNANDPKFWRVGDYIDQIWLRSQYESDCVSKYPYLYLGMPSQVFSKIFESLSSRPWTENAHIVHVSSSVKKMKVCIFCLLYHGVKFSYIATVNSQSLTKKTKHTTLWWNMNYMCISYT